jgi:hypothetical protein
MKLIVEFDWRDITPSEDVWDSIRSKYSSHAGTSRGGAGVVGYIAFSKDITPDEAIQILRLVRAQKASITINSLGVICYWRLNPEYW